MIDKEIIVNAKTSYKNFTLVRTDPYGFWTVLDSKGKALEDKKFDHQFTTLTLAEKFIDNHLDNLKKVA